MRVADRVIDLQKLTMILSVEKHVDASLLDRARRLVSAEQAMAFHLREPPKLIVVGMTDVSVIENSPLHLAQCAYEEPASTATDVAAEKCRECSLSIRLRPPALALSVVAAPGPQL